MSDERMSIRIAESDIKKTGKLKIFPDGTFELLAASRPIFGGAGWELSDKWDSTPRRNHKKDTPSAEDIDRSRRRAAAKCREYALCNDFDYFVTLTLDPKKIDRYSISEAVKRLRVWLDNRVRRNGLKYILVPELHKDGAVHFHGFFNACGCHYVDSGTLKVPGAKAPRRRPACAKACAKLLENGAQIVYNISDWSLGFSTAIPLYGERAAAVNYAVKYITKQTEKIGGRWYYSGGDLRLADVYYIDFSYREAEEHNAFTFQLAGAGVSMAIIKGDDFGQYISDGF